MSLSEEIHDALSELLNAEINNHGKIQKNNPRIWRALHSMDDGIWRAVLEGALTDRRYRLITDKTQDLINHLNKYSTAYGPWVLTPYEGLVKKEKRIPEASAKALVWRWLMESREIYCRSEGIDLPNEDSSKGALDPNPADNLFDWNTK